MAYGLAVSDRLEAWVRRVPRVEDRCYQAARRYVGGRTLEEALTTIDELTARGLSASLDFFGEGIGDRSAAMSVVAEYLRAAESLGHRDAEVDLEVVPSHLGIDESVSFFCENASRLAEALPTRARLQVSAEESHRTERIVTASLSLGRQGVPIQATIQANLRRSPTDAARLVEAGVAVRLVKGAYRERPAEAHGWGEETDLAYVRLAHQLSQDGARLALATHDAVILEALLGALPDVAVEMLLGVKPEMADELAGRGVPVRIYVPYGDQWFRYWTRRRVEALGS